MNFKLVLFLSLIANVAQASVIDGCHFLSCTSKPRERASRVKPRHLLEAVSASPNWGGYVAAVNLRSPVNYTVTKVSGSWVVPHVINSGVSSTNCSLWVGIDGYGSPSVEQLGTEHDWSNNQESHYAWWEMYPLPSHEIVGFPVAPGDQISASVTYIPLNTFMPVNADLFILQIFNMTKKVYTIVPQVTQSLMERMCAEWIVEAPWLKTTLPLSDFGVAHMYNCTAVINGKEGAINDHSWQNDSINMVDNNGVSKAVASVLSADGKSFSVQWLHT